MKLFEEDPHENLLPYGGTVNYFGKIISTKDSEDYFKKLLETIIWKNEEISRFGKPIVTARKVAWYADKNYKYTYSNTTKEALIWTKELLELKQFTEKHTGATFNSCLLNLYHKGSEGMAWHSDNEKTLTKNGTIASLSFGAERKFSFKHKTTNQIISILLETGSLLIMKDAVQTNWLHCLPPTTKVNSPRINLTFRTMIN